MFTAAYGVSIGPIGWVLPSEVFPLSMRSKGVALSTASNWLNNCNVPFFPLLLLFFFPHRCFFFIFLVFIGLLTPVFIHFSASLVLFTFPKKSILPCPYLPLTYPPLFFPLKTNTTVLPSSSSHLHVD